MHSLQTFCLYASCARRNSITVRTLSNHSTQHTPAQYNAGRPPAKNCVCYNARSVAHSYGSILTDHIRFRVICFAYAHGFIRVHTR